MKNQYSNCTLNAFKKHRSLSSQVIIDHEQSLSSKIIENVRGLGKKPCGREDDTFTRKLTSPRETPKKKDARDGTWVVTFFFLKRASVRCVANSK